MRRSEQRRAAVFGLYKEDVPGRHARELPEPNATPFTGELVAGVLPDRDHLTGLSRRHASGWSLDRIAPLERNILRVALHELRSRPDVPPEVAIDEAVEAAKELCSAETPGFVNGILGTIHRDEVASR